MKAKGASRGRGTASIADCPIMSVETIRRRRRDQNVSSAMSVDKCVKQPRIAGVVDMRSTCKEYAKEVSINYRSKDRSVYGYRE